MTASGSRGMHPSRRRLAAAALGLALALGPVSGLVVATEASAATSPGTATITSVTGAGVDKLRVSWKKFSHATSIDIQVSWDKTPLKALTKGKYFQVRGVSGKATSAVVAIPNSFKLFIGSASGNAAYVRIVAHNGRASSTSGVAFGWPSSKAVKGTQVRIATYNVTGVSATKSLDGFTWADRRARLARSIREADPSLIAIQEASTADVTIGGRKLDQYQDLANLLAPEYSLAYQKVGNADGGTKGDHILYRPDRLHVINSGLVAGNSLPGTSWGKVKNRYFAWALFEVSDTGQRLFFVSNHFQGDDDDLGGKLNKLRASVAKGIDGYIADRNPDKYPVFIAGDFNTRIDRAQDDAPTALVRLGYTDAASANKRVGYRNSTSNSGFPSAPKKYSYAGPRIDYIFGKYTAGPAVWTNQFKLLSNGQFDPNYYGSDHNLQWANFSLG